MTSSATKKLPVYTFGEEVTNALTHGAGAVLSIAGLVLMILQALRSAVPMGVLAASFFGISLIAAYTSSTLYHAFPWPGVKRLFQTLDHLAIYLLIAGSYTPFAVVTLGGTLGWALFFLIWAIAIGGIIFELLTEGRRKKIALVFYLAMGWLGLFFIKTLAEILSTWGMVLLVLGGVLYSVGVIFYALKKMPYNHAVWHLFVLAGSASHFFCIIGDVLAP